MQRLQILALSGSLRAASTNTALLLAARLLSAPDVEIEIFSGIGHLPHFNPDLDVVGIDPPATVAALRKRVAESHGLLIASPEYAHGIPGAFKNALDWLVSGPEFVGKPIAIFGASRRGAHAHEALVEVLTTMSGEVVKNVALRLHLVGRAIEAEDLIADADSCAAIRLTVRTYADDLRSRVARVV